ncbi:MAG: hypothetical protein IPJ86_08370 [Bacteroidetes bacterium]|jgi:hypothetical protein|nr:hypothetical protein [Bacteroidota bacterium]
MMNLRIVSVLLIAAALTLSCKTKKSGSSSTNNSTVNSGSSNVEDSLLVAISRGACFGACPQFKATVYKSGFAVYEGEKNVKKTGTWTARLSTQQLEDLIKVIRNYKMEEKDSAYVNKYLADYPAYFLWISDKKPRKEILINHEAPPVDIVEFTQIYERLLDNLQWRLGPGKPRQDTE